MPGIPEFELAQALVPRLRNRRAHKLKGTPRADFDRYAEKPGTPPPVTVEAESIDVALMVGLDALAVQPGWGTCETEGCGLVYELVPPWPGAKPPKACPACRIKVRGECADKCGKPATHGPHCWAHRQTKCAGWESACKAGWPEPPHRAFHPSAIRDRGGDLWRCVSCANRKRDGEMPPEKRRDRTALGNKNRPAPFGGGHTREQLAEWGRKGGSARKRGASRALMGDT